MGLKQNTSISAQLPLRQIGGGVAGIRSMWGRTDLRNQSAGQGIPSELAGIPSGHLAPSSWNLPNKPGAMSSFTSCVVQFSTSTPTIAAGRNINGGTTITFTVNPADGQLVVSAVGSTSITFTAAANLAGALSAQGAASFAFTVPSATLGAIINAQGTAPITWSLSATPRAIGNLSGDITPFTTLSPQSLAEAVLQSTVEGSLTLSDVQRILLAVAAGDATGLESGSMVFKSQDGAKNRIEATYSTGNRTVDTLDAT